MDLYTIYPGQDGRYHARFAPKVAAYLGSMAAHVVNAPTETAAREIAGYLVRDALTHGKIDTAAPLTHSVEEEQKSLF